MSDVKFAKYLESVISKQFVLPDLLREIDSSGARGTERLALWLKLGAIGDLCPGELQVLLNHKTTRVLNINHKTITACLCPKAAAPLAFMITVPLSRLKTSY
jgi:hypothetical protein